MVFALRPGVNLAARITVPATAVRRTPQGGAELMGAGGSGQAWQVWGALFFFGHGDINRDALRGETRQGTPTDMLLMFFVSHLRDLGWFWRTAERRDTPS